MAGDAEDTSEKLILGEVLNLDPPRSREPGMLTYANRGFLYNPDSQPSDSWPTQRQRVRKRITNGILDFGYLRALFPKDTRLIFDDVDANSDMYAGIREMLRFIYRGVGEEESIDFELLLEEVIDHAEREIGSGEADQFYQVTDVDVTIDVERQRVVTWEETKAKVESGKQLTDAELGALVRASTAGEEYQEALETYRERLREEAEDTGVR